MKTPPVLWRKMQPRTPRNETIIKRIEVEGSRIQISRLDLSSDMVTTSTFTVLFHSFRAKHFVLKMDWKESLIKTGWFCWGHIDEKIHSRLWQEVTECVSRQVNHLRGVVHDLKQQNNETRRCRVCGCTDKDCSQCIEKIGLPCYWVEEDLCSACEAEERKV